MAGETLIKVEHVSKKFCKDLKRGLLYGFQDLGRTVFGLPSNSELREKEFWAVDDISFEVKRGECLGLLGHNGAGKSTLLKVLTGLIDPDKGRVEMRGRVNALIELTAGFNPILTGRENIYNNGAVLGLSDKEIKAKFDEIVAFSELEEFIDTPVQYYSSGMKVRLGFSVAAFTEPDVLILDEVLAVGDAGFRAKSFNKMKEIMKSAAVIFVTHSMPNVSRICSHVLFMRQGRDCYSGTNIHKGIELYFDEFDGEIGKIETAEAAEIMNFTLNGAPYNVSDRRRESIPRVRFGEDLEIELTLKVKDKSVKKFHVELQVTDKDLKLVAIHYSNYSYRDINVEEENRIKFIFRNLELIDGEYSISYLVVEERGGLQKDNKFLCIYRNFTNFKVEGLNLNVSASFYLNAELYNNDVLLEEKSH